MSSAFTSIPIIDLSPTSDKKHQLSQLHHALTSIGFLYIRNHGVPADAIADLVNALPPLFSLTDAAKEAIALHNSPHFLGYSSVGAETTAGQTDVREQVEFATELAPQIWSFDNGMLPLYERLKGPNQVTFPSHFVKELSSNGVNDMVV